LEGFLIFANHKRWTNPIGIFEAANNSFELTLSIFFIHINLSSLVVERSLKVVVENAVQRCSKRGCVPEVGEIRC
jgi:hypothetical protein